jgi:hypothetical protein
MKTQPETPYNKAVDHSIVFLLTGMMLLGIFLIFPHGSAKDPSAMMLALLGALVTGVVFAWYQLVRRNQKAFTIVGVACVCLFAAEHILQAIAQFPAELSLKFFRASFSLEVLLALFLAGFMAVRHFGKNRFNNDKSSRYLLAGIGVVLLVSAVAGLALWPFSFAYILGGVIGLGCVCREPVMGVIVFWISIAFWLIMTLRGVSVGVPIAGYIGFACFLAALAIALNKFLASEFRWEAAKKFWKEMNRPAPATSYRSSYSYQPRISMTKSCSSCGREVSILSHAGERCPHCGVYWSSERQGGFRH